jgi:hypothetical protein
MLFSGIGEIREHHTSAGRRLVRVFLHFDAGESVGIACQMSIGGDIKEMRFSLLKLNLICALQTFAFGAVLLSSLPLVAAPVVPVGNREKIESALDQEITVEGTIERIGESKTRSILFVNFEGLERGGFTVIIRQRTLAGDFVKFDPEFALNLVGKHVRITGTVSAYRGGFQMQVFAPSQIEFLATDQES